MASDTLNLYDTFVGDVGLKVHELNSDTIKVALTNTAPDSAGDALLADITEIAAGNGYTAGGDDIVNTYSESGGVATLDGQSTTTITASGGSISTWQYAVFYNDTPSSPLNPLIGWVDFGLPLSLADGESIDINIPTNLLTLSA